jgi:hypothetical protein
VARYTPWGYFWMSLSVLLHYFRLLTDGICLLENQTNIFNSATLGKSLIHSPFSLVFGLIVMGSYKWFNFMDV